MPLGFKTKTRLRRRRVRAQAGSSADAVYAALLPRVAAQSSKYYARFPGDVAIMQSIVLHLEKQALAALPFRALSGPPVHSRQQPACASGSSRTIP